MMGILKGGEMLRFYMAGGVSIDYILFFVFVYKFGTFDHLKN